MSQNDQNILNSPFTILNEQETYNIIFAMVQIYLDSCLAVSVGDHRLCLYSVDESGNSVSAETRVLEREL